MLVMHIGPHKTATTYLQHNFYKSRGLLRKQGWLYPMTGERVRVAHHDISDDRDLILSGESRFVRELTEIGKLAEEQGLNILLSSEGFQRWKPVHCRAIMDFLRQEKLHIVYALRDPCVLFYSHWAQAIKNGETIELQQLHERHFGKPEASRLLNPMLVFRPLARQLDAKLTLLNYETIVDQKLDIFSVFAAEVLKMEGISPVADSSRNSRFPIELTEFIRVLNPVARLERGLGKIEIGNAADYLLRERERREIVEAMQHDAVSARRLLIVERESSGLRQIERTIIRQFGKNIFPKAETDHLYPAGPVQWAHYDTEALLVVPKVQTLLEKTTKRISRESRWIRGINWTYATAISLRRQAKALRLKSGSRDPT